MSNFKTALFVGSALFMAACAGSGSGSDDATQNESAMSGDTYGGGKKDPCPDNGGSSSGGSSSGNNGGCHANYYFARGTDVNAKVLSLDPIMLVDTGANFNSAGDHKSANLVNLNVPNLLVAGVATASADGDDNKSTAQAKIANASLDLGALDLKNLGLDLGGILGGLGGLGGLGNLGTTLGNLLGDLSIKADVIEADSMATCGSASGTSTIANLKIGSTPINITGQPNQTLDLFPGNPLGLVVKVVINEQIPDNTMGHKGLTVNALHAKVALGQTNIADVVLSSADADIACSCK